MHTLFRSRAICTPENKQPILVKMSVIRRSHIIPNTSERDNYKELPEIFKLKLSFMIVDYKFLIEYMSLS